MNDDFDLPDVDESTLEVPDHVDVATLVPADDPELRRIPPGYIESWNRTEGETDRQWELFLMFRDAGPTRTMRRVIEEAGADQSATYAIAKRNRWKERAADYDRHMDRVYRMRLQQAAREQAEIQANRLAKAIEVLAVPFEMLAKRLEADPDFIEDLEGMTPRAAFDLVFKAAKVMPSLMNAERLALGQPSEIVQHEGEVKQTYEIREPDRLAAVLAVLHQAGAIPQLGPGGRPGEVIDAEGHEIHDDDTVASGP